MTLHKHSLFMALALREATRFVGATAPNPPVGACVVLDDKVIALAAHEKAGTLHAEAKALEMALQTHDKQQLQKATLYVTLEPCNHVGKTPACTGKILESGVSHVVYGVRDPNPKVAGNGTAFLKEHGVSIQSLQDICGDITSLDTPLAALIRPFAKFCATHTPYFLHKLAYRKTSDGLLTLIPEAGMKTFTSEESLAKAHLARKQSDAIITGIETVLADRPLFNVRHTADHAGKRRILAVLSRSGRQAPSDWIARQHELGFDVQHFSSFEECSRTLAQSGVVQALIEAGPKLSAYVEKAGLWDERLIFLHDSSGDFCYTELACSPALSKK